MNFCKAVNCTICDFYELRQDRMGNYFCRKLRNGDSTPCYYIYSNGVLKDNFHENNIKVVAAILKYIER